MMSNLAVSICAAYLTLLIAPACHLRTAPKSVSNDPTPLQAGSPSNKSSDLVNSGVFDNNPKALKAWLKFIEGGKYRPANADDFKFSEAAKSELRSMFEDGWYSRVNHPAITGNIHRHGFKDLAVIVVDAAREDPARFGLVIFNLEPDKEETTSVHWLFRSRNLSTAILSWHNNWPVLVFYREDGASDPYYINWNENAKLYSLDKRQVGPDARAEGLRGKRASASYRPREPYTRSAKQAR